MKARSIPASKHFNVKLLSQDKTDQTEISDVTKMIFGPMNITRDKS